jgi:hypothetical protein
MTKYDTDEDETEIESEQPHDVDDLEAPPEPPKEATAAPRRVIKRGWGYAEQVKNAASGFAQTLKVTSDPQVIKFLEDDPYTSYRQHWLERNGQKSFVCIADLDPKGCPLCDAGDRAAARFAFNVALIPDDGGDAVLKSYEVGTRIIDSLKIFHQDPRQGPLPKNYWAVSKTGTKGTSQTNHQMVRERDLKDEWEIDPLTDEQIALLKKSAYSASIVTIPNRKDLLALAAEELEA